jgi:aminopeptidase N
MMRFSLFLLAGLTVLDLQAQELFTVRDEGETRNRAYDVLHYKIEVSFDEPQRKVIGRVSTTLVPFPSDLRKVVFDAEEMDIQRVSLSNGTPLAFSVGPKTITIFLDRPYTYRDTITLTTDYTCKPHRGLFFIQPDSSYSGTPWQIWTQGEDMDNHFWFPCYDFPNDRATSEIIATVRPSYTVLSNGKLLNVTEDRKNKTKTFHWKLEKPHVSYLIMMAIGEYAVIRDSVGRLPLEYYVYPQQIDDARICFQSTPDIMRFFNKTIGVAYPWEKYSQALIRNFTAGGMENTSACSLLDHAAVFDARQRVDESPVSLIAHELAHQWWGDLVTCKDWRHLWLNESFASYFDPLYHEYKLGPDEFHYTMYEDQQAGINSDKTLGRKPIVSVGSYGSNLYPRGASVLHMLRFLLGDSLFFRSLTHYITKHQYGVVETNDLKVAIEETTGQNLYWFFDQWVYKAGYPVFAVSSEWDDSSKSVRLHVEQTQKLDSLTGVFRTPVDVEVTAGSQSVVHRVDITTKDTVFVLRAPEKPRMVIFDKGNWLIKELRQQMTDEEWEAQVREASDPVDRLRAVKWMGIAPRSERFLSALIDRALHDPFWAVRREAVNMLGVVSDNKDTTWPAVKGALLAAAHDPKSRVRTAAVALLTDSADASSIDALHAALKDSSYSVVSRALRALAKADPHASIAILRAQIGMPSHQNIVATSALNALVTADSMQGIAAARECLAYGTPPQLRNTALWILRRFVNTRTLPESTLYPLVRDANIQLRTNAVRFLGDIGSGTALPVLEAIAENPDNPAAEAAKLGIERIRKRVESAGKK